MIDLHSLAVLGDARLLLTPPSPANLILRLVTTEKLLTTSQQQQQQFKGSNRGPDLLVKNLTRATAPGLTCRTAAHLAQAFKGLQRLLTALTGVCMTPTTLETNKVGHKDEVDAGSPNGSCPTLSTKTSQDQRLTSYKHRWQRLGAPVFPVPGTPPYSSTLPYRRVSCRAK